MSNADIDPTCLACGHSRRGIIVSEKWSLTQCATCTHVFATQLPDNRRFESEEYVSWRDEASAEFLETAQRRYRTFHTHSPELTGRVLEFGCSTGEVLSEFTDHGWQAVGTDFSDAAIRAARNRNPDITFYNADDNEILEREGGDAFDLIMAFHVVEHVPDIERLGANLQQLCKPNGYVFFAFPYWDAWSRKVFGDAWPDLAPEHLHFFTRKSIAVWLQRNGFELTHTTSWGRAWQWLGGVKRVLGRGQNVDTGDAAHQSAPQMPDSRKHKTIRRIEKLMRPLLALEEYRCAGSELAVIARRID